MLVGAARPAPQGGKSTRRPCVAATCPEAIPGGYLCVPLIAQGETLGVFHLRPGPRPKRRRPALAAAKEQLAVTVAEDMALALANLRLRETLRSQAIRDPLTGLFNRRYMEETMERELNRVKRQETPLGVIMMDLDHFKDYNDTFGHNAGDELLSALGTLVKSQIRGEDIACRYGGEEFLLILPGASMEIALERAEGLASGRQRDASASPGLETHHPLPGRGRLSRPRRHRGGTYPVGRRRPLPGQTCRPGPGDGRRISWRNHLGQSAHPATLPPEAQLSLAFDSRFMPFPARLTARSATGFPVNCTRTWSFHPFKFPDEIHLTFFTPRLFNRTGISCLIFRPYS